MATRTNSSRDRILTTAESIILQKGYVGTSIEEIVEKAAITKGGFFYHFQGKSELARALVKRYVQKDVEVFNELLLRADQLSEDPLQRMLIFLNLFSEMIVGLEGVHPGCLAASFTYELQQLDEETRELMKIGMLDWRRVIAERIEQILPHYKPRIDVSVETLADMFTGVTEGGIILARIFNDNKTLADQVQAYRAFFRLVFDPSVGEGSL